jgi:hypothetical protein
MEFPDIVQLDEEPGVTVDGLPRRAGENWSDYHGRALAWIAGAPSLSAGQGVRSMKRVIGESLVYTSAMAALIGMVVYTEWLV